MVLCVKKVETFFVEGSATDSFAEYQAFRLLAEITSLFELFFGPFLLARFVVFFRRRRVIPLLLRNIRYIIFFHLAIIQSKVIFNFLQFLQPRTFPFLIMLFLMRLDRIDLIISIGYHNIFLFNLESS